jgi:hypothetical protein
MTLFQSPPARTHNPLPSAHKNGPTCACSDLTISPSCDTTLSGTVPLITVVGLSAILRIFVVHFGSRHRSKAETVPLCSNGVLQAYAFMYHDKLSVYVNLRVSAMSTLLDTSADKELR